ncbi:hypothetical protein JYB87_13870 [Shewanella avicenniae]|uniref:Glyoxalase-like domain-containing protein n=1 Tax=Shewanella avicenniae TaxID=2814294 RepID=A0ABX7QMZ7_9GAMM|nr:hypothetical protein [Shewanella avicenniae]QSX32823.1 hypothetical protein JYB87_13870 [Shewanella avicenniae]
MDIDHLFILCSPGAPEADVLDAFGLKECAPRDHQGQGTANRRFFFGNIYLELLYVVDEMQLQADINLVTRLPQRFDPHNSLICPFGVCYSSLPNSNIALVDYRPKYLPDGYQLMLAADNPLTEPMWFFLFNKNGEAVNAADTYQTQQLLDAHGLNQLTSVIISMVEGCVRSTAAKAMEQQSCISLVTGLTPLMELIFDDGLQGRSQDFRPALPLVINW